MSIVKELILEYEANVLAGILVAATRDKSNMSAWLGSNTENASQPLPHEIPTHRQLSDTQLQSDSITNGKNSRNAISEAAERHTSTPILGRKQTRTPSYYPDSIEPNSFGLVEVVGDSMVGAGIEDGDWVIYDKQLVPVSGDFILIRFINDANELGQSAAASGSTKSNEVVIKQLHINFGKVTLKSRNAEYDDFTFEDFREIEVFGKPILLIKSSSSGEKSLMITNIADRGKISDEHLEFTPKEIFKLNRYLK